MGIGKEYRYVGLWGLVLGVTLLGAAIVSAVVPGEVVLRGQAVDGGGNPLVGTRAYVVRFFDAETGGTLLAGPITGTTTLTPEGLFSIPVVIPDAALDAAQVWYELGIDSNTPTDGVVRGSEVFVGRVRLWSVPYARVSGRVETVGVEQLAGGVVSTSEFTALDGVTGNIQAQLDTKANAADVYTKAQVDASQAAQDTVIAQKANSADVYTKSEVDTSQAAQDTVIAQKANSANVYTKSEVDTSQAAQDTVIAQKANSADVYTKAQVDASQAAQDTVIAQKANSADVYTKSEVDTSQAAQDTVIAQKANSADVYTKAEVDTSQAAQDTVIAQKADTTYVDTENAAQDSEIVQRFRRQGESYVIAEVTNNPATNATNLLAAYAAATALTPYGQALSATNRAVVLLPPGQYDLGVGALSMTAEYVDVVGMSSVARHQHVYGQSNGASTGVIMQTANDVRLENLWVECTRSSGGLVSDSTDPAAYFPDSNQPLTEVRNCAFTADDANAWSMRIHITYSGKYTDCTGGDYAFGGYYGTASGTFTNCTGGYAAFGGYYGTASGMFTNCTGGDFAFGSGGTASGTFTDCTGGNYAFGGVGTASGTFTNCTSGYAAFGGSGGTASGTFTNCTGANGAFGGNGGTASGTFNGCTGGDYAFGGSGGGIASGMFINCFGGYGSFGGFGLASGTFTNCRGGNQSFGGFTGGTAAGTFVGCTGGDYAFGGSGGTASGTFTNCTGGMYAFGAGLTGGGSASGTFINCAGNLQAFGGGTGETLNGRFVGCTMAGAAWGGTFRGRMENCRWNVGISIGAEGRVYHSVILGNVTLTETGAGIANTSVRGTITVSGGVTPGFNLNNVADPDVN
jgi:hypothetical protein